MPTFDTVTVAAIQATPVILSSEATIAVGLLGDAAQVAVFPEPPSTVLAAEGS